MSVNIDQQTITALATTIAAIATAFAALFAYRSSASSEKGLSLSYLPIVEARIDTRGIGPDKFTLQIQNSSKEDLKIAKEIEVTIRSLEFQKHFEQLKPEGSESIPIENAARLKGEDKIKITYIDMIGKEHLVEAVIHQEYTRPKPQAAYTTNLLRF